MLARLQREIPSASILRLTAKLVVMGATDDAVFQDGPMTVVFDGRPSWTGCKTGAASIAEFVRAYRSSGIEALQELDGPFALVLHDATRDRSVLAVDRVGIRPMAYTAAPGGSLVFSSNVAVIAAHPLVDPRPSLQSVYQYLYFHVIPSPNTIYEEIFKLEPATCLIYEDGKTTSKNYWTPRYEPIDKSDLCQLQDELRSKIRVSVRHCAYAPKTASFLSGGVDSSTIAGVFRELRAHRTSAYTIGFDLPGYDEMAYAEAVTRHFDLELRDSYVTASDVARTIPIVGASYDEPFGNSSAVAVHHCAQLAQQDGIEVLLAGDGGDEVFAGNSRYAKQQLFELYFRIPSVIRQFLLDPIAKSGFLASIPGARKIASYVRQANTPMPARLNEDNMLAGSRIAEILHPAFIDNLDSDRTAELMSARFDLQTSELLLHRMLFLDWKFTLADNDLRKVNRMCEVNGIEAQYPLLSNALIDLSTRVPADLLIKRQQLRFFFKDSMSNFLPKITLRKAKHGFGLPFGQWLNETAELQAIVYPLLQSLGRRGIVKPEFLDYLVKACREDHPAYYGSVIWPYMMLEQWLQTHAIELRL